jgi:uncharacterized protein YfdQ (DUF2303 family)
MYEVPKPRDAATDVSEFITDLDGGQLETMLSVALSKTAAAVVDNGKKGKAARKVEAEEQSLSAERSVMESVAATSKNAPLPEFILFSCAPFACLSSRVFVMRLSVRTGDANKPSLSLGVHLIREEEHAEQMAQELADKVKWALMGGENDIPVYLGEYRPRQ